MIGVPGDSALPAKCNHDLRPELADPQSQVIDNAVEFLPVQLPVGIIQKNRLRLVLTEPDANAFRLI